MYTVHKDIAYLPDDNPHHTLDIYIPTTTDTPNSTKYPLVVYVHGGAWRTDDKSTVAFIGPGIIKESNSKLAVSIINYRLSTRNQNGIKHPAHLQDTCAALNFLTNSGEYPGSNMIDHQNVHVIGHSAGAHLATLAVLQGDNAEWISSIKSVLGIGGIYDIPGLLSRYPSYLDFVDMAFTPNQYKDASPVNAAASMAVAQVKNIPFMVVNSTTDELIDAGQAERFARALEQSGFKTELRINSDIGDHYGQLERPEFWRLAVEFVETN